MATAIVDKTATAAPPLAKQDNIQLIPLDLIVPSYTNETRPVDESFLATIIRDGVVQPAVLRPHQARAEDVLHAEKRFKGAKFRAAFGAGDKVYMIVAGECRWEASILASRQVLPAVVRDLSDEQALEIQIIENEHRKDLSILQRGRNYARLIAMGKTPEQVAKIVSQGVRTVYEVLQVNKDLIAPAQDALSKGEMLASHAYAIAPRPREEQEQLLKWMRTETLHSQGDVPSVRRLKREIERMDFEAEEKRKQEKLFKDDAKEAAQELSQVAFDGKIINLTAGQPLPGSVRTPLLKHYPKLTMAHFLKDGRVQIAEGLTGRPFYLTVPQLEKLLGGDRPQVQTSAKPLHVSAPDTKPVLKPPTKAQLKAQADQQEKDRKAARKRERDERIDKKYRALFFAAFASKAQISSRFLTHVLPDMILEMWDNELPIEAFAQNVLQWPAPAHGEAYGYDEVRSHVKKHTRKFTAGLLAAIIVTAYNDKAAEQLARYFGVDPKKLRKQAVSQLTAEEAKARAPRKPETQKDKQLYAALNCRAYAVTRWDKLRRTGASYGELREAIAQEMGDGGQSSKALGAVSYKGQIPAIWFNKTTPTGPASLQGSPLVNAVRDLLKIPDKGGSAT